MFLFLISIVVVCVGCTNNVVGLQNIPGDIVRGTGRDAGFNRVRTIQAHRVKSLVVTVPKGIKIDVGLGRCSGWRLTWKHTQTGKENNSCITYFSSVGAHIHVVPVWVTSSETTVCPDGFNFGSQCPATVKPPLIPSEKNTPNAFMAKLIWTKCVRTMNRSQRSLGSPKICE